MTHRIAKRVLIAMVVTVALAVPAVSGAATGGPLIVPSASTEHMTPGVLIAPASSSEHTAPSIALIVPATSAEHRPAGNAAVIATAGRPSPSNHRWALFAVAGLLLAVIVATAIAVRVPIRGRGAAA